jgi:hypothetical protein
MPLLALSSFAGGIADAGFGFSDPVGPRAPLVGILAEHHAHVGLRGDLQADPAGKKLPCGHGVLLVGSWTYPRTVKPRSGPCVVNSVIRSVIDSWLHLRDQRDLK